MQNLTLNDLVNPREIKAVLVCNSKQNAIVEACDDQGFQEYPGSIELWQSLPDSRLLRVKRWLKKSIICTWAYFPRN